MIDRDYLFFVDAETDGLHGSFISVAIIVTDKAMHEIERAYLGIKKENLHIQDAWVKENVVPILGDYEEVEDEAELLEKTWQIWEKYRENAYAIGDVIFPVEARLFSKCVARKPDERKFLAPFPFLDLANLIFANGISPLIEREQLLKDWDVNFKEEIEKSFPLDVTTTTHNALYDVEITILVFKELLQRRKKDE